MLGWVLCDCSAAVISATGSGDLSGLGLLRTSLAFGLADLVMAFAIEGFPGLAIGITLFGFI